jgi:hypothetical protein
MALGPVVVRVVRIVVVLSAVALEERERALHEHVAAVATWRTFVNGCARPRASV